MNNFIASFFENNPITTTSNFLGDLNLVKMNIGSADIASLSLVDNIKSAF